ncbi:WD40 repeat-like protein, partial [Sarocladium strictum]
CRKGPSFLSRLSIRGSWRKDDDMQDSDSELGELRTDGYNARAMTTVMGAGGGFIPLYKEPPRYIRVKPHNKKTRSFNRLFLAQELQGTRATTDDSTPGRTPAIAVGTKLLKANGAAIWAAEFSTDGRYLAVAGKDQVIRIFAVISTPEERQAQEEDEEISGCGGGERLSAPVFLSTPAREFEGHGGDVLALCWSKNNFLLSSSMDKTVKLWHMSRDEALCTFAHDDLVTSIAFHPTDDRFFLAGSLDAQLRLWSIPDKEVAFAATTTEFITAVAFSPDGKIAMCGLLTGLCNFYDTEQLKLKYQIHVRSSRGRNAKGSKITGIRAITVPSKTEGGEPEVKVLITSNDSRLRIYTLKDRMLEVKLKGLENQCSQIHARFSDDGKYIVCGSEDRKAYLWNISEGDAELKDKQPYECFDAHPEVVTTALIAPIKSKQLLSSSGDPIYDLCNPPPVQLVGLDEQPSSRSVTSDGEKGDRNSGVTLRKPEESPAYIERSKHNTGNIVITTDRTGSIKVFRQDCAYSKRQQNLWETGSKFSGKINGVGRSGSVVTKTSGGSRIHSRRGSLNLGHPVPAAQPASDRIMSWRQDVEGGKTGLGSGANRSERSLSPMKSSRTPLNASAATLASEARRQPYMGSPVARSSKPTSPTSSIRAPQKKSSKDGERPSLPPTPSFSMISAS